MMSSTTTSWSPVAAASNPRIPSCTTSTACPSATSPRRTISASGTSSSTSNTRTTQRYRPRAPRTHRALHPMLITINIGPMATAAPPRPAPTSTAPSSPTCASSSPPPRGAVRSARAPGTSSAASCCPASASTALLDPGSPLPRAVPAGRQRHVRRRRPRRRDDHRHRPGRRARVRDRRQRRHRQGRHLLPDDGQEAPARPGGGAGRTGCRASTSSTPAAPSCPRRTRCSPTASTSAASSTTRPRCRALGIPQIAAVLGSCTAGGAYVPAMSDEAVIVRNQGTIFLGGPPLVKAATGEVVTAEELGGGDLHSRISGVTDHLADDDAHALRIVRDIVATLGPRAPPPVGRCAPAEAPRSTPTSSTASVPVDSRTPYDVREVIARSSTARGSHEFKAEYGTTLVTGFARIHGHPVGIVANNGILFSESALKGAHFIELCDQRGIPLVFLQNISGFMVGREYEAGGIAKHGAKMVTAVACTRVPEAHRGHRRLVRRGQLLDVRAGLLAALPVDVAQRPDLGDGRRAGRVRARHRQARPVELAGLAGGRGAFKAPIRAQYERQGNPYYSTARLWDDGVIDPLDTRTVLGLALSAARQRPAARPARLRRLPDVSRASRTQSRPERVFDTVLVANRGEIAVRVIRTLRALGHPLGRRLHRRRRGRPARREADTAVRIGPGAGTESYLSIERRARRGPGAPARRPSTPATASSPRTPRSPRACDGGRARLHRAAGRRRSSRWATRSAPRQTVAAAGRARGPRLGRRGPRRRRARARPSSRSATRCCSSRRRAAAARACGWCATRPSSPTRSRPPAARPAAAFGDDTLLVERLVDATRGTSRSRCWPTPTATSIHLGERECSLQRRHQKIIEEAPSPLLDEEHAGGDGRRGGRGGPRACGYVGAGTVEFIVDGDDPTEYFFMEMNTRLQVEHPVTELVTGARPGRAAAAGRGGRAAAVGQDDVALTRARRRGAGLRRGPGARASCRPAGGSCALREPERRRAGGRGRRRGRGRGQQLRPDARQGDRLGPRPRRGAAPARRGARRHRAARRWTPTSASCARCSPTPTCAPGGSTPGSSAAGIDALAAADVPPDVLAGRGRARAGRAGARGARWWTRSTCPAAGASARPPGRRGGWRWPGATRSRSAPGPGRGRGGRGAPRLRTATRSTPVAAPPRLTAATAACTAAAPERDARRRSPATGSPSPSTASPAPTPSRSTATPSGSAATATPGPSTSRARSTPWPPRPRARAGRCARRCPAR